MPLSPVLSVVLVIGMLIDMLVVAPLTWVEQQMQAYLAAQQAITAATTPLAGPTTVQASEVQQIWDDYVNKMGKALTKVGVAALVCIYGGDLTRKFLDLVVQIVAGRIRFSNPSDPSRSWDRLLAVINGGPSDSWADNLLHAIMEIGPENVRDMSVGWDEMVNGKLQGGDVDLIAANPPRYIEVGGPSKGWESNLFKEVKVPDGTWWKEKAYAERHGAIAQLYLQKPSNPSELQYYNNAVDEAIRIFGRQNVIEMAPIQSVCQA